MHVFRCFGNVFYSNSILVNYQHGFRQGHSCETQLITIIESVARNLDLGQQSGLLLLDFSKAFDTVPHQRLLNKLDFYGIHETIILHPILPVKVNKAMTTYAFYDNGSAGCFLMESLKEQIGAEGERTKLQLSTMHSQSLVATTVVGDLIVTDMEGNNAVEMPRSYTQMEIPVNEEQTPMPEMVKQRAHLREVAEKMPKFVPSTEIGMLIGSNCPAALEPLEVVPSEGQGPYAMRLHHSWTISGPFAS